MLEPADGSALVDAKAAAEGSEQVVENWPALAAASVGAASVVALDGVVLVVGAAAYLVAAAAAIAGMEVVDSGLTWSLQTNVAAFDSAEMQGAPGAAAVFEMAGAEATAGTEIEQCPQGGTGYPAATHALAETAHSNYVVALPIVEGQGSRSVVFGRHAAGLGHEGCKENHLMQPPAGPVAAKLETTSSFACVVVLEPKGSVRASVCGS